MQFLRGTAYRVPTATAGVRALVAPLWKMDDDGSRVLLERFYERLLPRGKANGDVAAALQGAMISMLSEGYAVRHWAALAVYGLAELGAKADAKQQEADFKARALVPEEGPSGGSVIVDVVEEEEVMLQSAVELLRSASFCTDGFME